MRKCCRWIIGVLKWFVSIEDVYVYGDLESCKFVIVVCECCGSVMNMYGVLKDCWSVIVVCEYNESEVDVYGDKWKEGECGYREEREDLREESSGKDEYDMVKWCVGVCRCVWVC